MKAFLGLFLVVFDLLKGIGTLGVSNLGKKIKHFFFVQSWWRLLIILILVGIIGFGYNIFGAAALIGVTIWYLLFKQEEYAKKRGNWDSLNGNEHFIIPSIISLFTMIILQGTLSTNAVPKYEIIKNITLNEKTVTEKAYVYLNVNGASVKLDTGNKCKWGQTTKLYKEVRDVIWINPNIMGDYYLDCNRPMKKFTKI
jgi:hypothetical protein